MSDRVLVQKGARSCGITTFLRGSLPNLFTYLGRHVGMYLTVFTLPVFRYVPVHEVEPDDCGWGYNVEAVVPVRLSVKRGTVVRRSQKCRGFLLTDSSSLLFPAHGAHGGRMLTSNSTDHYHLSRETGRPIEISAPVSGGPTI
ncbi:hypothetical protein MCOR02_002881 [Pyricularia oryzae]|nr:hypothetical protein MCOR02_002881 [Pyricularia oryzae]KAI6305436.1 hypothetical protein MCOR34_008580 [Pyricularia oryzae]KAI6607702.1 hypothetical protein MCOR04_000559 [Pyricularia oryzae]